MNARAKRPRSRRGRHLPPGELDPLVESSEELEAASGTPEPSLEPPQESHGESELVGSAAEAGVQGTGDRTDKELDGDSCRGLISALQGPPKPAEEVHQASEAAPGDGDPDVFQTLQHALSSLEATAAAWRQQPPKCPMPMGALGPLVGHEGVGDCQREAAHLTERNAWLQLALGSREDELARMQASLQAIRAEKETLQKEVQELQDSLLRLKPFPPPAHSQVGSSDSGSSSPGADREPWGTQDPFPLAHPLLRRLRSDSSTQILRSLPRQTLAPEMHIMEVQIDQLRGNIEKLKCFNRLLSAVLQGYRGRCEGLSMQLGQREAEATALHLALQYSEHCEEAYGALLALWKANSQSGEGALAGDLQAAEKEVWRLLAQEEAAIAGGAPRDAQPSPEGSSVDRPTLQEVATQLRGYIQRLQKQWALVKIPPEPGPTLAPIPNVPRAEAMLQTMLEAQPGPALPQLEKMQIQKDLVSTQEALADLTLRLQLARREKRSLELREAALRALGPAHLLLLDQLRWEQAQLQAGGEDNTGGDSSGGGSSGDEEDWPQGPLAVPSGIDGGQVGRVQDSEELAQQLEMSLSRAADLRGQLWSLWKELEQVAQKARARRAHNTKLNSDLCKAHSALVLTFRGAHRKQEEQQRKLEQQVALMEAQQAEELAALEATARALRRSQLSCQPPQPGETLL
ncbi:PREDICTED: Usher syndrome type-1C protein-binding protein 1 [Chrysochloris asiatica]|uniref:Usher syndrome type-1C protein-binding protein 1 n=1 Tax=Chrysochloris asiatica TaxID=185453 RepID=A0A9B0U7J5_CHRAS|nr:PREDICTED: Usher syndrome type-1C protein-binding protein 1 [Chrysochloris asiatica]